MRFLSSMVVAVLALAASGCETVRYELRPPASESGRWCVTQCAQIRETCRSNELHRAREEREQCEYRTERNVNSCLARADSKERRKDCMDMRHGCYSSPNEARCEADYRGCFGNCGGAVIKHVEK
jgi:hypothetical protein